MSTMDLATAAETLRALHHGDAPLVLPNAWDAASARLFADKLGYPAVATTSAGVAESIGHADGELTPPDANGEATARLAWPPIDVGTMADHVHYELGRALGAFVRELREVPQGAALKRLREDHALVETIDACLRRYGLPRVPADIGMTADEFSAAVVEAPQTRPDRCTVLEHLALDKQQVRERVDAYVATFAG